MYQKLMFVTIYCLNICIKDNVDATTNFMKPLFNTMTPYFWVNQKDENIKENEESSLLYKRKQCRIVYLNLLLRHSARYPSLYWIRRMANIHKDLMDNPDVVKRNPFLKTWTNPFPEEKEYSQSIIGDEENVVHGHRFAVKFKQLFDGNLNRVNFSLTSKKVTHESFDSFYQSFNETLQLNTSRPNVEVDNKRLHFYTKCRKYDTFNSKAGAENTLFKKGKEMDGVVNKINKKLGTANLNAENVITMQQICAFELGMFNKSDWCNFFDLDDLNVIDYSFDLLHYWKRGYGYDINWQISCPFTSHLFKSFDNIIQNHGTQKRMDTADIQFAHSYTILPIYTAFGLFKDDIQLLANNFKINGNRSFRSSKICPFSANLAIGLYNCGKNADYVIKMFVNEKSVNIPGCGQRKMCSYTEFKNKYKFLANCNFNNICRG